MTEALQKNWAAAAVEIDAADGMTMLEVARAYDLPLWRVKAEFVWADLFGRYPIGRPDCWSVWRAPRRDVAARFGPPAPERPITQDVAAQRARDKAHVIRALLGEDA